MYKCNFLLSAGIGTNAIGKAAIAYYIEGQSIDVAKKVMKDTTQSNK